MSKTILLALAAATLAVTTSAQACSQSGGNWYCDQVKAVSYLNFGASGTYNRVSYMNDDTGECRFESAGYSGTIAPFDEELSVHIRGPFSLKQFAFYTPSTNFKKRRRSRTSKRSLEPRQISDGVRCTKHNATTVKTLNGKSFVIECAMDRQGAIGYSKQTNFASCIRRCASTSGCAQVTFVEKDQACWLKGESVALRPEDYKAGFWGARLVSTTTPSTGTANTWARRAYYNAKSQTVSGVTFMNNMGGGSFPGKWSMKFGNSLGYSSSNGLSPAMSPQTLADTVIPSTSEISLWTSTPCSSSNPCPYYRPGTVANHGFGGDAKIFFFEFSMPHASGADMPALWLLNAQVPRTQQYGSCSCWGNTDGCGEVDVFEVLTTGEERMISALHGKQAATNPNYFARPSSAGKTVKGAVALVGRMAHIRILDDDFDFDAGLSDDVVKMLTATGASLQLSS